MRSCKSHPWSLLRLACMAEWLKPCFLAVKQCSFLPDRPCIRAFQPSRPTPESGAKGMSVTILPAPLYGATGGPVKQNAPSPPLHCTDGGSYRPRYLPYSTAEFQGTLCGRKTGIQPDNQDISHGKFRGPRRWRLFLWKRFSVAKCIAGLAIGAVPVPAQGRRVANAKYRD